MIAEYLTATLAQTPFLPSALGLGINLLSHIWHTQMRYINQAVFKVDGGYVDHTTHPTASP
jgi:hypothetical protein